MQIQLHATKETDCSADFNWSPSLRSSFINMRSLHRRTRWSGNRSTCMLPPGFLHQFFSKKDNGVKAEHFAQISSESQVWIRRGGIRHILDHWLCLLTLDNHPKIHPFAMNCAACLVQIRYLELGARTNGHINISKYSFNNPKRSTGS